MTFYNVNLPHNISSGSQASLVTIVDIARAPDGSESRRSRRSQPLMRYDIGQNVRTLAHLYDVAALFRLMDGPLHSFALKDEKDYKSCVPDGTIANDDASIGTGDGTTAAFQLKKQYSLTLNDGSTVITTDRTISIPKRTTVLIAVAGSQKTETTHYTVDYDTGIVTFTAGNIPTLGQAITAGFEFDVKVRFDIQDLNQVMEEWDSGSSPSIPLIEVSA